MITTLKILSTIAFIAILCIFVGFKPVVFVIEEGVIWLTNCLKYAMGMTKGR